MHRYLILVFALFSLPFPRIAHAQFTEAISAPTPSAMDVQLSAKSPYEVVNNSRIFTAEVTLTVAWEAKLTNPKGVETDKEYGGRSTQTTVRVGPGQRAIPGFFAPTSTADYVFVGPVQVGIQSVKWPNQWIEARNEESRLRREADQKKREEDARIARQRIQDAADAGRTPVIPRPDNGASASTDASGPFATFLARLKRSGRTQGYYPGDPHYGAGYYDVNGSWLGKTEPPAADGTPGRNPGFDQFGTPMSLSQFDKRFPDEPAQVATYSNLLPTNIAYVSNSFDTSAKTDDDADFFGNKREWLFVNERGQRQERTPQPDWEQMQRKAVKDWEEGFRSGSLSWEDHPSRHGIGAREQAEYWTMMRQKIDATTRASLEGTGYDLSKVRSDAKDWADRFLLNDLKEAMNRPSDRYRGVNKTISEAEQDLHHLRAVERIRENLDQDFGQSLVFPEVTPHLPKNQPRTNP